MDAQDGLLSAEDGQEMGRAILTRGGSWQEALRHVASNGWGQIVRGDERQIKNGEQPPLLLGHFVEEPSLIDWEVGAAEVSLAQIILQRQGRKGTT